MTLNSYKASEIARITGGTLHSGGTGDPEIHELLIDSRRFVQAEGTLFIALVSPRNDGHRYIAELAEKGVRTFMVQHPVASLPSELLSGNITFILVTDTLEALQKLAAWHRTRFHVPVIGITGSNGKTIVKEWLYHLLSPALKVVRSPKSYNSQVGVPLSVWKMDSSHQVAIFEAGISQPGEMERLEQIIRPEIGILTNLGSAHDEYFRTRNEKLEQKMKLFRNAGNLVYCADHTFVTGFLENNPEYSHLNTFTWSFSGEADLRVLRHEIREGKTILLIRLKQEEFAVTVPFTDEASLENILHCIAAVAVLRETGAAVQLSGPSLNGSLSSLAPVAMRLELKEAINHCSLINDSYTSDLHSLAVALDFMNQQQQHLRRTVILSDMLQTGRPGQDLYPEIFRMLEQRNVDRLIGIGPEISVHGDQFNGEKHFFPDTDSFITQFPFSSFQHETILLKGARVFEFERISHLLQQKHHETVLEINLDALVHNLNYFRSLLTPGTRTMVMVKAFSYGSGSYEIAAILQYHHADYLAVAYADEGVELRKAGITLPVMVMSPEEQSLDAILKYNLEPEIYNFRILDQLEEAVRRNQTSLQEMVRVHIKLDTGMHRLGFIEQEMGLLLRRLQRNPGLYVQSVFSHLSASEDPGEDAFTREQFRKFRKMSDDLAAAIHHPFMRHILNSAGISRFPEAHFDMVRLGIGLHGIGHSDEETSRLRNVGTLRTVITQIREVAKGESIGYNRSAKAERPLMIAVLPVGYADGMDRRLGNGNGRVFLHGEPVPTIGNICMDLTLIDVTRLIHEGFELREGDEVIVFGDLQPVTELASQTGTIPYEILTGISRRVKRVYFYE